MLIEKTLSASRITIRNYQRTDLPFLTAMWFDEENGKYLSDPTREYVDSTYQTALDGLEDNPNGYYLTVVLNNSRKIIGSCCIFPDDKNESFDIGYCIHKNYWGRGLGKELILLIVNWVYDQGGIEITAEAAKENIASNCLLINAGFKIIRESKFKKYNMDICYESFIYRLSFENYCREIK